MSGEGNPLPVVLKFSLKIHCHYISEIFPLYMETMIYFSDEFNFMKFWNESYQGWQSKFTQTDYEMKWIFLFYYIIWFYTRNLSKFTENHIQLLILEKGVMWCAYISIFFRTIIWYSTCCNRCNYLEKMKLSPCKTILA